MSILSNRIHPSRQNSRKSNVEECICVYGTAFSMPVQQKLPPPVLLFSDFADWNMFPHSTIFGHINSTHRIRDKQDRIQAF